MYELFCGYVPFGEDTNYPIEIYQEILQCDKVPFPPFIKSTRIKKFIRKLLNKQPSERFEGSFS